jgi:LuxR family maltose regulon positive regulatory protein
VAALAALGIALELAGRDAEAVLRLDEALTEYAAVPMLRRVAHTAAALAATHRASLAMTAGSWRDAREQVAHARSIVRTAHLEEHAAGVVVDAVAARLSIQRGAAAQARLDLARAQRNRPLLTYALPWQAVRTRLDLARVCLALGGLPGARTLLVEVRGLLEQQPELGTLVDEADALREQVNRGGGIRSGPYSLTLAELRLLPLLGTHLTFREIGQRLFLSPNTVKSQALSIYRKLDASSRSEAVSRAAEAGLTEALRPAQLVGQP